MLLTIYMWLLERRWPIPTRGTAFRIGAYWVALTIVFEFGFGHYVDGKSWTDLLNNYNLVDGQAWVLVLVWMAVAPAIVSRTTVGSRRYFLGAAGEAVRPAVKEDLIYLLKVPCCRHWNVRN